MKNILFVVAIIGAWIVGKIKLSEPPSKYKCEYCLDEGVRHNGYFEFPCGHCNRMY